MVCVEIEPSLAVGGLVDLCAPEPLAVRVHCACKAATGFLQAVYRIDGNGLLHTGELSALHLGHPVVVEHYTRG